MTKPVLETSMIEFEELRNRLLDVLEWFSECMVGIVVNSLESIGHITEVIIDNPGFVELMAVILKSEQRNYTEKKAMMKERCRQFVEDEMKHSPVAFSHPLEIGQKPLTDISDDIMSSLEACSMATSHSKSNICNPS